MNWWLVAGSVLMLMGVGCALMYGRALGLRNARAAVLWQALLVAFYALGGLADMLGHDHLAANIAAVGVVSWLSVKPE